MFFHVILFSSAEEDVEQVEAEEEPEELEAPEEAEQDYEIQEVQDEDEEEEETAQLEEVIISTNIISFNFKKLIVFDAEVSSCCWSLRKTNF